MLCSYLLTFIFIAINPCFNSSITKVISLFFTLHLAFNSLIFIFPFPPVSLCLPFSSLLIFLLRLVISLQFFSTMAPFSLLFCLFSLQLLSQPKELLPLQVCLFKLYHLFQNVLSLHLLD